jgi:hypothetical protein
MCLGQATAPQFAAPPTPPARPIAPPPGQLRPATAAEAAGQPRAAAAPAAAAGQPVGPLQAALATAPADAPFRQSLMARDQHPAVRVANVLASRGKRTPEETERAQFLDGIRRGGSFLQPRF